jgi:hypothetical protein
MRLRRSLWLTPFFIFFFFGHAGILDWTLDRPSWMSLFVFGLARFDSLGRTKQMHMNDTHERTNERTNEQPS